MANQPFRPTSTQDFGNTNLSEMSISFMKFYENLSFEEIRYQDYW